MLKWFCDACRLEIQPPEHPVKIRAYRVGKNRKDADIGWGEDIAIGEMWCHKKCADGIEIDIKKIFAKTMEIA